MPCTNFIKRFWLQKKGKNIPKNFKYAGEIRIREEEKIEELRWFSVDELPDRMLEHDRVAIGNYFSEIPFCELGWAKEDPCVQRICRRDP